MNECLVGSSIQIQNGKMTNGGKALKRMLGDVLISTISRLLFSPNFLHHSFPPPFIPTFHHSFLAMFSFLNKSRAFHSIFFAFVQQNVLLMEGGEKRFKLLKFVISCR
jgi:hypothetical protein